MSEVGNVTTKTEVRKIQAHLRDLSAAVTEHLAALDREMNRPGSPIDRGKNIALLANELDMANDRVRYFALGVDYRTDKK